MKYETGLSKLFAKNLAKFRSESGMTFDDLAAKSGLESSYISRLEAGTRAPTLATIHALANSLKVPAVNFFIKE